MVVLVWACRYQKNIMDIHEGSIFVENKKNGGVRATLIFKVNSVEGGVLNEQKEES